MKKITIGILFLLCVGVATASIKFEEEPKEGFEYFVEDDVYGRSLRLFEFDDEYGFIEHYLYEGEDNRDQNKFEGFFEMGYPDDPYDPVYFNAEEVVFYGKQWYDDGSILDYELTDFELVETNMDEFGMTEVWGEGNLTYEMTITVVRSVPVETYMYFDKDHNEGWNEEKIVMTSLDDNIRFQAEWENEEDKDYFRRKIVCYGDLCEQDYWSCVRQCDYGDTECQLVCEEKYGNGEEEDQAGHTYIEYVENGTTEDGIKKWVPLHVRKG